MKSQNNTSACKGTAPALADVVEGGMFTVADVMRMSGFSRTPILKDIEAGKLPAARIAGRLCMTRSDLVAWVGEKRADDLIAVYQRKAA
jgi:hypothetical protein